MDWSQDMDLSAFNDGHDLPFRASNYPVERLLLSTALLVGVFACVFRLLRSGGKSKDDSNVIKGASHSTSFPPSRRAVLASLLPGRSCIPGTDDLASQINRLLDLAADYRDADASKLLFTGFSVDEVRALGDFPDYAALSGVPLPTPVPDFKLERALPRPYRPFRWAYHQTMCMISISSKSAPS